jgi:ubiquinone/menaquinone biosynthesis C-methylase UbiE
MEDSNYYWDSKIEYLKNSRTLFFNDSYFEYLVNFVWKIDKPITLIDFGCGTGYLGAKLMPLLPQGSRYIGLDRGEKLLDECREAFSNLSFESEFHKEDITNMDISKYIADITICQTVLQHMKSPKDVLETMKQCTRENGLIISINPMWTSSMANFYVHEIPPLDTADLGILQKLYDALLSEGYGTPPNNMEKVVDRLSTKGITREQAKRQYEIELNLNNAIKSERGKLHILWAPSLMVLFSRK